MTECKGEKKLADTRREKEGEMAREKEMEKEGERGKETAFILKLKSSVENILPSAL